MNNTNTETDSKLKLFRELAKESPAIEARAYWQLRALREWMQMHGRAVVRDADEASRTTTREEQ